MLTEKTAKDLEALVIEKLRSDYKSPDDSMRFSSDKRVLHIVIQTLIEYQKMSTGSPLSE